MINKSSAEVTQLTPLCVRPKEAARLIGVSPRKFATMRSCGQLPPVIKVGGCLLYRVQDLQLWLSLDCPSIEKFIELKGTGK
jgi:hypothetical protein